MHYFILKSNDLCKAYLNDLSTSVGRLWCLLLLGHRVIMLSAGKTIFFGFSANFDKDVFRRWNVLDIGTERSGILIR